MSKLTLALVSIIVVLIGAFALALLPVHASATNMIGLSREMPKQFRGIWAENGTSCKKRDSFKHAKISKKVFFHRKSKFEIAGVRKNTERNIVADVYLIADGTRHRTDIAMDMVDDYTMAANIGGVSMIFIRCSTLPALWNDIADRAIDRM